MGNRHDYFTKDTWTGSCEHGSVQPQVCLLDFGDGISLSCSGWPQCEISLPPWAGSWDYRFQFQILNVDNRGITFIDTNTLAVTLQTKVIQMLVTVWEVGVLRSRRDWIVCLLWTMHTCTPSSLSPSTIKKREWNICSILYWLHETGPLTSSPGLSFLIYKLAE